MIPLFFLTLLATACAIYFYYANRRLTARAADLARSAEHAALSHILNDATAVGLYVLHGTRFVLINTALANLLAYSRDTLLTLDFLTLIHPDDRPYVSAHFLTSAPEEATTQRHTFRMLTQAGAIRWVEVTVRPTRLQGQDMRIGTLYDLTEHRALQDALLQSQMRYESILRASPDAITLTSLDGIIQMVSPAGLDLLGSPLETQVLGRDLLTLVHPEDQARAMDRIADLLQGRYNGAEEYRILRADGSALDTEINAEILRDATGAPCNILFVVRDVSERKKTEARIHHLAQHDVLTGLANRMLFTDRLQQALVYAERDQTRLALLFLDLDKFKYVNDQYGHGVGDLLLQHTAKELLNCVRASDVVARIGGDEFIVLLRNIQSLQDAMRIAEIIRQRLSEPCQLAGHTLHNACSIGVALYPEHGSDSSSLYQHADNAMYQAKQAGRNRIHLYHPGEVLCPDFHREALPLPLTAPLSTSSTCPTDRPIQ